MKQPQHSLPKPLALLEIYNAGNNYFQVEGPAFVKAAKGSILLLLIIGDRAGSRLLYTQRTRKLVGAIMHRDDILDYFVTKSTPPHLKDRLINHLHEISQLPIQEGFRYAKHPPQASRHAS